MMPEQLSFPKLKVPSRGPVAVFIGFKDIETGDPKILLAKKPSGRYTLPGGKSKPNEKPTTTTIREVEEETGLKIYSSEFLISPIDNPIRIAADGFERDMHLFFGFVDECTTDNVPQHPEPDKNEPWQYVSVSTIPALVARGQLHLVVSKTNLEEIVEEALDSMQAYS